jgi:hypothetical protein
MLICTDSGWFCCDCRKLYEFDDADMTPYQPAQPPNSSEIKIET